MAAKKHQKIRMVLYSQQNRAFRTKSTKTKITGTNIAANTRSRFAYGRFSGKVLHKTPARLKKEYMFTGLWAISFFKCSRINTLIGVGLVNGNHQIPGLKNMRHQTENSDRNDDLFNTYGTYPT
jgi:hypothetical protein